MSPLTPSTFSMHTAPLPCYARALSALLVQATWILSALAATKEPIVLDYYMHHDVDVNLVELLPPYDNSTTGFGFVAAMDLPLTVGPDPNSTRLGAERCISTNLSMYANSYYMSDMHLCTVTYDDGVYRGVFNTMGEFNLMQQSGMEYGVVGGAVDFRGVQGYVVGTLHSNVSTHIVYHFSAYLRLPEPPMLISHNTANSQLYN